jgi:hypothetical protein
MNKKPHTPSAVPSLISTQSIPLAEAEMDQQFNYPLKQFQIGLCQLEHEFIATIYGQDVSRSDVVRAIVESFGSRLEILKLGFLRDIQSSATKIGPGFVSRALPEAILLGRTATEVLAVYLGVAFVAPAVSGIVVSTATSGFWIWKTTADITLAAKVAAVLGLASGPVGWGITLTSAVATGLCVRPVGKMVTRRLAGKRLIKGWCYDVRPALEAWANDIVSQAKTALRGD